MDGPDANSLFDSKGHALPALYVLSPAREHEGIAAGGQGPQAKN